MKCPECEVVKMLSVVMETPDGYQCLHCGGTGWLPFWTPAERAGLKAMGKLHHDLSISGWYARDAEDAIRVYVRAARGIKEED